MSVRVRRELHHVPDRFRCHVDMFGRLSHEGWRNGGMEEHLGMKRERELTINVDES